jgi:ADP-heptose:LPS heptosyltransferase
MDDPPMPQITVPPTAIDRISGVLQALTAASSHKLIVVHLGTSSSGRSKRAPLLLFTEILRRIAERQPIAIGAIGAAEEKELAAALLETLPPGLDTANLTGELSLVETSALLARADLFIGNDSGPLKLAEAVGAPTVSFWGPTAPSFTGPRGERHRCIHFEESPISSALTALYLLDRGFHHPG